jgi:hypothetical protein
MKEPSAYEKAHWRLFNSFARFVGALMALASGFLVYKIITSLLVEGTSSPYPPEILIFMVPVTVVCIMIIKVKPYYPAEYREWFETNKKFELSPEEKRKILLSFSGYIVWGATFFITFDIVISLVNGSLSLKSLGSALTIVFVLQILRFVTVSRLR